MKRLLLFWALFLCSVTTMFAQFSGSGAGTESDPYKIFYAEQLTQVRNFLGKSGVYFTLMSDIDLGEWIADNAPGEGWQPIGVESSKFKGVFNGNGHTIYGMTINRPSGKGIGFFGYVDGATVSNLTIEGDIVAHQDVGGFAGNAQNSTFDKCTFKGTIKADESLGGIVGSAGSISNFTSCATLGSTITGGINAGGIVGYTNSSSYDKCEMQGCITGTEKLGGIVGNADNHLYSLQNSLVRATITGTNQLGGLVGYQYGGDISQFSKNSFYGKINGESNIGGLVGRISGPSDWYSNTYSNNYSISDLNGSGDYVGGLVGYCSNENFSNFTDNYHSGEVYGNSNVGGLFGHLSNHYTGRTYINTNISIGSVYGSKNVGGIAGEANDVTISKSVSAEEVISASVVNVGRICGSGNPSYGSLGTADGNLALSTTKVSQAGVVQTITDDNQNGTSISEAGLKLRANYVAHGWDFNNNWTIQETETYPYKPWQAAAPTIESNLVSQATTISGKSIDGGTVYLEIGDNYRDSTVCSNNKFSFSVPTLQSGVHVRLYAVTDGKWQSQYTDTYVNYPGKGTQAEPYLVYTANDLQGVYKKGYYKLMNDVDLTSWINENSPTEGWPAIGKNGISSIYFDGDGHTISGLWCNTTADYNGLFSNFPGGYIRNLNVKVADGKEVKGGDCTGIVIGKFSNGNLDNVTANGTVVSSARGGGIVGASNNLTINNAKFNGSLKSSAASAILGGISGVSSSDVITRCISEVQIASTNESVVAGGLLGRDSSNVSLGYSTGAITLEGTESYAGGLIGQNMASGVVTNCYSLVDVNSTLYAAGLVAYNYGAVSNSYAKGNVNSTYYGAGCVGYNDGASATINNLVAGNPKVNVNDQSGWSIRVLGGYKNGAADPGENNYALNTMILSVNGVTKKATDNLLDGYAHTEAQLMSKATYEGFSWDFTKAWTITDGMEWPQLNMVQTGLVTDVTVSPTKASVKVGETVTLTATVAPSDAENKSLTWASSNTEIARVRNGIVTGVSAGTATITVTSTDGTNKSASAEITVYAPSNDSIVLPDTTTLKNKTINYPIYVGNNDAFCSFQMDIYLPEGMSIAKNDEGDYNLQFAGRETSSHSMTLRLQSDGAVRVVAFSASNKNFKGSNGALINIPIVIGDMAAGDYAINVKNIVLADKAEQEFHCDNAVGIITVKNYIKGDVNGDEKVTLADVNSTVNYIVGDPSASFNFDAADMNDNGVVNVTDVNSIVNVLLDGGTTASAKQMGFLAQRASASTDTSDKMYCNNLEIAPGETKTLEVCLDNESKYCSFQFDLILPDGLSVVSTTDEDGEVSYNAQVVTSRCTNHVLADNLLNGNRFRVVVFSLTNKNITGKTGPVVTISLKADNNLALGEQTLRLENMTLATADEKEYYPANTESKVNVVSTGIENIKIDPAAQKIYNLQGIKVNKVTKGVYIVNGKKVVKK